MAGQNRALSHQITLCAIAMLCLAVPAVHAQWVNYKIPGVPRTPDGKVNLTAPTPRTPDGKPDLGGTWHSDGGYFGNLGRDLKAGELQMLPWAEAQVKENQTNLHKNDPMVACLPPENSDSERSASSTGSVRQPASATAKKLSKARLAS